MPAWVSTAARPAPRDKRVFVRFGSTMFDAGYCSWRRKWFMLVPGGSEQEIADPPLWFDRDAPDLTLEAERELIFGQAPEQVSARPRRGQQTLALDFTLDDSRTLSRTSRTG